MTSSLYSHLQILKPSPQQYNPTNMRSSQQTAILSYKPEHPSVSHAIMIEDLVDEYNNQNIKNALSAMTNKYFRYRKIRGDGNCFVRAVAFSYLYRNKLTDFDEAFKDIRTLRLNKIYDIPQREKQYYNDKTRTLVKGRYYKVFDTDSPYIGLFQKMWNHFVQALSKSPQTYQDILADTMNKSEFFDMMIILYFRSICISNFQKHRQQYRVFYQDDKQFQNIQKNLKTYGQESEGFMIKCMADTLNCQLVISQVDKNGYNSYTIDPENKLGQVMNVHLFYRPGHYDILVEPREEEEKKNVEMIVNGGKNKSMRIKREEAPLKEPEYYNEHQPQNQHQSQQTRQQSYPNHHRNQQEPRQRHPQEHQQHSQRQVHQESKRQAQSSLARTQQPERMQVEKPPLSQTTHNICPPPAQMQTESNNYQQQTRQSTQSHSQTQKQQCQRCLELRKTICRPCYKCILVERNHHPIR